MAIKKLKYIVLMLAVFGFANQVFSQEHGHSNGETKSHEQVKSHEGGESHDVATAHEEESYTDIMMHHISNANDFHVFGDVHIPLPVILYGLDDGSFHFFMSSAFEHGHKAIDGYVMNHGSVMRLADAGDREHADHIDGFESEEVEGHKQYYAMVHGKKMGLEKHSSLLGFTSFIDFSISKNVFTMLISLLILVLIFMAVKRGFDKNEGKAPTGIQSFFEPLVLFIRDDVARPAIGDNYNKYFPFILSLFFFVLVNNLLGLVPFFPGGANVTGNVGSTAALAIITFIVVNISANKNYWMHIFAPPVPKALWIILIPIELAGIFIKPFTLLIRLFANIVAGHIIILSLIGLIFMFGQNGHSMGGAMGGIAISVPFVFAMNFLELFVAFLQAFIFALLASLYIGAAIEEHH